MHNNFYNKQLKPLAKANRKDSTKAEIRLWCELLSRKQLGYSFLRQRPVFSYIADFMCKELKLIIEVDGYSHNLKTEEDYKRDAELTEAGFTVLRFSDDEVMKDLSNVQRVIENWIVERKKAFSYCKSEGVNHPPTPFKGGQFA
ncbi:MAG: endonuclease domain-containing protein [Hymenobacteraceae bacterium]|nr:endonuclease domain-containing protein [Hymenobacteraceae bacterium]MDX5397593.1 endonuclease domain-containing protein [Hymenobacteraceae bacterium]MDX5443708.1 endonuclease domain-containing protein [Hymenobacteraceae bacterium]MDX5513673.1 endonuclease domain-containing protein [Hymenobacteraceae bacterium]